MCQQMPTASLYLGTLAPASYAVSVQKDGLELVLEHRSRVSANCLSP